MRRRAASGVEDLRYRTCRARRRGWECDRQTPRSQMPFWQSVEGVDKNGLPTLPERAGSQNSRPALGRTMHRACLIAASCVAAWVILALPLGVTAAAPAGQDTVTQPEAAAAVASPTVAPAITPAPGAGIQDTQAMLAVVRMFGRMPGTL